MGIRYDTTLVQGYENFKNQDMDTDRVCKRKLTFEDQKYAFDISMPKKKALSNNSMQKRGTKMFLGKNNKKD